MPNYTHVQSPNQDKLIAGSNLVSTHANAETSAVRLRNTPLLIIDWEDVRLITAANSQARTAWAEQSAKGYVKLSACKTTRGNILISIRAMSNGTRRVVTGRDVFFFLEGGGVRFLLLSQAVTRPFAKWLHIVIHTGIILAKPSLGIVLIRLGEYFRVHMLQGQRH